MTRVRIDRIDVDLPGVRPAVARAMASELGAAIQRQIGRRWPRMNAETEGPQMERRSAQSHTPGSHGPQMERRRAQGHTSGSDAPQMERTWAQMNAAERSGRTAASGAALADRVARQVVRRIER